MTPVPIYITTPELCQTIATLKLLHETLHAVPADRAVQLLVKCSTELMDRVDGYDFITKDTP